MSALVIGLGNVDRGDDGVGPTVVERVRERGEFDVVVTGDPLSLIDLWDGHQLVVVVDAVTSRAPSGTIHVVETGVELPPLPAETWSDQPRGGSHALGVATAVELGRALGRLPTRLVVIGVEANNFDHGAPLSAQVAAAIEPAAQRVIEEVDAHVSR